jgi:YfiH family protein
MFESASLPQSSFILPDWPAPNNIVAFTTTRVSGFSKTPFDSLNLAQHVGDDPKIVEKNRTLLPNHENYFWLNQTHSTTCLDLDHTPQPLCGSIEADACFSQQSNQVCAVMTADCLPILLCDKSLIDKTREGEKATSVAAIHAGWRGLADGVIENSIQQMCIASNLEPKNIIAWMGPAISQNYFEVGQDVKQIFKQFPQAFKINTESSDKKYFADLYYIAKQKLIELGIQHIYGGDRCTYSDHQHFFSHRRATHQGLTNNAEQGRNQITTGRMVSAIYFK